MTSTTIRILIVDDEQGIRESLRNYLEDFGFEITTLESSEEAMSAMENESFDIGIIDLRLPGTSGDRLILMAHERHPEMKFLIHTGSNDFTLPAELEAIGMVSDQIIYKPVIDLNIVVDKLRELAG